MPILSLEASTSSAKAMLYDAAQGALGVESMPYAPGICDGVTFSPAGVADTLLACGAALMRRFPGARVEAIGLSSIWHSLVLLDGNDAPIGRGHTWADASAAPAAAAYRADEALARRIYRATGCPVHSAYNIWKWLHAKRTEDVSRVRRVSCLPEYLFYALTGELAISQSVAAGSGFLSAQSLDWDEGMLNLAGVGRAMLGRLVEPYFSLPLHPTAAAKLGLPAGMPVAAAGPDGALNHIAAGGLGGNVMTLSVGTSGALRLAHAGPVIPERQSMWCYYGAEGLHLIGAATSGAGNCVNWFVKDLMRGSMSFRELEAAASEANAAAAPFFLPFLFGERCPGWNDGRLGGFCGIGPEAGSGGMYRAILEGILFNLYQNYLILIENTGRTPAMISVSGGITQSPLWMGMAGDIFGHTLHENTGEHASLLGAAYMAQRAAGQIASLKDIPAEAGKKHEPDMDKHKEYMTRFEKWMEYYDK